MTVPASASVPTTRAIVPEGVARVLHDGAPALFVSPHLDDAVLSCAALMRRWRPRPRHRGHAFLGGHAGPHTRAARTFLRQLVIESRRGDRRRRALPARRREDIAVLDGLGVR